ncbi:MAG: transketolase C-terminal domain-containing protein [Bdellovibrionota bacterium]
MRNLFAQTLYEVGMADPNICCVVADISPVGSMELFRKQFPEKFIDVGVSEQGMIGLCAGMALRGFRPFAYTIATFSAYRPFEMIRDDLCYQNLPVTVVGMGAGIIYSTLGGTHLTQEDVGILSPIPNISILAPCDPLELAEAIRYCAVSPGPVYLRIGKAGEPNFTDKAVDPFEFGKIRYITKGTDVCVLAFGHVMDLAGDVAKELAGQGRSVSLVSCHTMKPIDREGIAKALKTHSLVVTIEEHSCVGGLAAQVKQIAWDTKATCALKTFSLKDEFVHVYGSHAELRQAHGLSRKLIIEEIGK